MFLSLNKAGSGWETSCNFFSSFFPPPRLISMFAYFVVEEITRINCSCVMDVMTAIILFAWFLLFLMYPRVTGGVQSALLRYSSRTNPALYVHLCTWKDQKKSSSAIHLCRMHSLFWNIVKMSHDSWLMSHKERETFVLELGHNFCLLYGSFFLFIMWQLKLWLWYIKSWNSIWLSGSGKLGWELGL